MCLIEPITPNIHLIMSVLKFNSLQDNRSQIPSSHPIAICPFSRVWSCDLSTASKIYVWNIRQWPIVLVTGSEIIGDNEWKKKKK